MVSETGQAADDSMIFDPSDEFVSDHDARHALENDVLEMESSVTCEAGLPVEDSGAASEEQERTQQFLVTMLQTVAEAQKAGGRRNLKLNTG